MTEMAIMLTRPECQKRDKVAQSGEVNLPAIENHELNLLSHHVSTNAASQLGNTKGVKQGCADMRMG